MISHFRHGVHPKKVKSERREGDSNPRDAKHHRISNPAPYRAWLSRLITNASLNVSNVFNASGVM